MVRSDAKLKHGEITGMILNVFCKRVYAHLGYGSKDNVPDTIKSSIEELVVSAAVTFFKTRGEL